MKKFTSILCALAIALSVSAAPVKPAKRLAKRFGIELKGDQKQIKKAPVAKLDARAAVVKDQNAPKAAVKKAAKRSNKVAKAQKDAVTFEIAVTDITSVGAKVTVTPSDDEALFYWNVVEPSEIEGKTAAEIAADAKDNIDYMILIYQYFYGETYTYADFLSQGESDYNFSELDPNTDYVVIALPVDDEINATGDLATKTFKTAEFVITGEVVELGELECTYVDDYRDDDGSYILYFGNDDETIEIALNIYDEDFAGEFTEEDIDAEYSYYSDADGELQIHSATIKAELSEDGKTSTFTVSLIALNGIQYNFTSVVEVPQEEEPVDPTGGTFTIKVEDITPAGAKVTVTPSIEGATYYWTVATAAEIEGLSDADIVKNFIAAEIEEYVEYYGGYYDFADFLLTQEDSYTYSKLSANTDYVVVAAYLDKEGNLQESVVKEAFKTLEAQDPTDATFTIKVEDITVSGATVTVTPSVFANFYWSVYESAKIADLSDADIVKNVILPEIEETIEYYKSQGRTLTLADFLDNAESNYTFTTLLGNTDYVVVAAYLDNEGNLVGAIGKEAFKTLEPEYIDLTFNISKDDKGINITPSDNENAWDYIIVSKAVFDSYGAEAIAASIYGQYGDSYAVTGAKTLAWDGKEIAAYCKTAGTYVLVVWGAGEDAVTTPAASFEFEIVLDAVDNINADAVAVKRIEDGQLIINVNGVRYNAVGATIR